MKNKPYLPKNRKDAIKHGFLPIPGCDLFLVKPGNPGLVFFCGRRLMLHNNGYKIYPRKFVQHHVIDGHPYILIRDNHRTQHSWQLGKLVLMAKLGRWLKPGEICCHNNGKPLDNYLNNVRADTKKSDVADMKKHGVFVPPPLHVGEEQHLAKLDEKKVVVIRFLASKYDQNQLAKMFQVNRSTIRRVIDRKTWKHVPKQTLNKRERFHLIFWAYCFFKRLCQSKQNT